MGVLGPHWKLPAILFASLAVIATAADIILVSPRAWAAYACPACFGLEGMGSGIYVETTMPLPDRAKLARMISQAREQVASFYGSFEPTPVLLVCATEGCARRLGEGAKATAFGASFIRVAPAGTTVTILAHEFSHIELHARIGLWKLLRGALASWFDEGVAVIVSNDARYLKPGNTSKDRCLVDASAMSPASLPTSIFQSGWGSRPGLYAAAACNVLKWMDANGGRESLLAAVSDVADGKRKLP